MKRIKIVISTLVLLFGALLASCSVSSTPSSSNKTPSASEAKPSTSTGTLHYHTYSNTWTSNDTKHWHAATCGHNVVNSEANHTFGDWYVKKEPTDSATGLKVRTCSVCGYEQSETIDKLEHTHTYSSAWSSNSTSHWHSATCGHDVVSSKNSHNYSAWTVVQNATETSTGLKKRTCNTCGYEQSQTIDKVEHTHTYSRSWTNDENYHWHASTCGHDVVSEKSSHTYGRWTIIQNATTSSTGLKVRYCSVCNYEDEQVIEQIHNHTYETIWTSDENYHWHASTCGHDVVSEKDSHEFDDWIIVSNATVSSTGLRKKVCDVCGYEYKEEIPKLDPSKLFTITWVNWDGTVLEIDENVLYGETPSYDGETPTRESTVSSSFKFSGWSPTVNKVTKNQTYTAQFIESELSYTFYFDLNDGTSPSYVKSKVVKTLDAKDFFFDVTKANYKFRGWSYNDTKVFDEAGNLIKNVKLLPEMTFKAIFNQTNKVTIISNMVNAGEISQGGEYPYNTDVDLYAHPYQGYEFVGWYEDEVCISHQEVYRQILDSKDVTIEARFGYASFDMNIESYNADYGLVGHKDGVTLIYRDSEEFSIAYTSEVSIVAYSKTDTRFIGWYDNDNNLVSTNAIYTFLMPNYDYKLIAKWNYFTISYEYDSDVEFDDTVLNYYTTEMTNLVLPEPKKTGYTFLGWYYNDQKYTEIDPNSVTNYKFVAKFSMIEYKVNHYKQNLDGTYPVTPTDVDNLKGVANTYTNATLKEYEGFTAPNLKQTNIKADGSTVVRLYYVRNSYDVVLTIVKNESNASTKTLTYKYEEGVSIDATLEGYKFNGWYKDNIKFMDDNTFDFEMPKNNLSFTIKYIALTNTKYVVNHYKQNIDGTYSDIPTDVDNLVGTTDTNTNATLKEYEGFASPNLEQSNINCDGSTVVKLYYIRNSYNVVLTIVKNETNISTKNLTYKYEEGVSIDAALDGYTFNGWYKENIKFMDNNTLDFEMPNNNLEYELKYKSNKYIVKIDYGNYCYNGKASYEVEYDSPFTFPIAKESLKEYSYTLFEGWKYNDKLIVDSSGYIENWNIFQNITLTPSFTKAEDNVLYFGSYPQTEVIAKLLIDDLNEKAGELPSESNLNLWKDYGYYNAGNIESYMYYIDIDLNDDNLYDYRGVYFTKYRPDKTVEISSSQYKYNTNKIYWFKYDFIKWRILEQNDNKALILSDLVLDSQDFNYTTQRRENVKDYQGNVSGSVYANNYMYSHIRSWLNTSFYDTVFSSLQKEIIQITTVDNSLKSTTNSSNDCICENTNDKIFLLSLEEINKYFTSNSGRQASATAYALCQGVVSYNGCCYWLRSPEDDDRGYNTYFINVIGDIYPSYVYYTHEGVRPACWINL